MVLPLADWPLLEFQVMAGLPRHDPSGQGQEDREPHAFGS